MYMQKNEIFLNFVRDLLCFGENRTKKDEKNDENGHKKRT